MAGCLTNCHLPDWECFDNLRQKRNSISSIVAGTLFGLGWWIIADAAAAYPDQNDFPKACHTCGVVSTLALIMVNSVSNSQVRGDTSDGGCLGSIGAKIWFFAGFILSFGALIGSAWILFGMYVVNNLENRNDWPGIAVFLQNLLIFFSAIIFKFGRSEDLWDN
ncbi:transmembrane protein 50B-like [Watersipora subatra]|uniref:transmembrane protein 50B-like n=1 Tax=Watersipora subatra TaxID=2589382 RepID=UPI00355B7BB3